MIHIVVLVIQLFYIVTPELELPDYGYDHGHCPLDTKEGEDCGYVDRWFIDKRDHSCKPFEYKKSGGNFNNFATQAACKRHLILTHNEKAEGCTQTPADKGKCNDITEAGKKIWKYTFFKTKTPSYGKTPTKAGDCVEFEYTGCGGNHNRYDSEEECIQACRNKPNGKLEDNELNDWDEAKRGTIPNKFDCFIKPDVKNENPPVKIIAELEKKRCVFAATAPDNEEERRGVFSSLSQCVSICFPTDNEKIGACQKDTPDQYDRGSGSNAESNIEIRYFYKKSEKVCKRFESWKGTFNIGQNNFPSLEMCVSYCGAEKQPTELTAEETCLLEKASVYNNAQKSLYGNLNIDRWHYNKENDTCENFKYGGIGGNSNNFKSIGDCNKICKDQLTHLDLSIDGTRCGGVACPTPTSIT